MTVEFGCQRNLSCNECLEVLDNLVFRLNLYYLGLRLLVEKRGRLHLVRVSVFGKVQSDHVLPVNVSAVCSAGSHLPRLENYGDVCFLFCY